MPFDVLAYKRLSNQFLHSAIVKVNKMSNKINYTIPLSGIIEPAGLNDQHLHT